MHASDPRPCQRISALSYLWDDKTLTHSPVPPSSRPHDAPPAPSSPAHPQLRHFYRDHISTLVWRTNTLNGVRYRDDPAVMM